VTGSRSALAAVVTMQELIAQDYRGFNRMT
jgi:hypothetical protein